MCIKGSVSAGAGEGWHTTHTLASIDTGRTRTWTISTSGLALLQQPTPPPSNLQRQSAFFNTRTTTSHHQPLYTQTPNRPSTPPNTQHNHVIPLFIHLVPLPAPLPTLLHRPRRRLRRPLRRQLPCLALGRALLPHVLPLDIAPLPELLLHPRPSRPRQPQHQQPKLPPRRGRRDIRLPIRRRWWSRRLLRPA